MAARRAASLCIIHQLTDSAFMVSPAAVQDGKLIGS
jgi:hypothetical protein